MCAHGFDHDPARGSVAQRFAREVLERDRIVREDAPPDGSDPADAEIENLVAIPLYLHTRFTGVIVCANRDGGFEELDDDLLLALGDHAGAALQSERLEHDLRETHRSAMRILADVLDARDPVLRREAGESVLLSRAVARRLGLEDRELEVIASAALVRDVGQVAIPERILLTPGALSPDERTLMEMHPRVGAKLIAELPAMSDIANAVLYHHERVDGTGYPAGLVRRSDPARVTRPRRRRRLQRDDPRPAASSGPQSRRGAGRAHRGRRHALRSGHRPCAGGGAGRCRRSPSRARGGRRLGDGHRRPAALAGADRHGPAHHAGRPSRPARSRG